MECARLRTYRRFLTQRNTSEFKDRYSRVMADRRAKSAARIAIVRDATQAMWPERVVMTRKEAKSAGLKFYFSGRASARSAIYRIAPPQTVRVSPVHRRKVLDYTARTLIGLEETAGHGRSGTGAAIRQKWPIGAGIILRKRKHTKRHAVH
jgi:hypothetical protein